MREVDQALARAYSQRVASGPAPVPPAPHHAPAGPQGLAVSSHLAPVSLRWPATVLTLEREYGDRFARLADALVEARTRRNVKIVLFTSCHRAEGRTTLVLNLARALARTSGRTLVVDGDLTGPVHARLLGLRPTVGLDDVVGQNFALADALVEARDVRLSVLPLRAPVADPKAFLAAAAWTRVLASLRREFDHVLIDGSPIFVGLSAAVSYRSVDAAVLVVHPKSTGGRALPRALEALDANGIPLLGLAETFVA